MKKQLTFEYYLYKLELCMEQFLFFVLKFSKELFFLNFLKHLILEIKTLKESDLLMLEKIKNLCLYFLLCQTIQKYFYSSEKINLYIDIALI